MSLIGFHRFLIATAIVFCLGFGVWELSTVGSGGGLAAAAIGSVFVLLGGGLSVYLRKLGHFLGYDEEGPARG